MNKQPSSEVCSNPKGGERASSRLAKTTSVEHMLIPSQVLSFVQILPLIDGVSVQEIGSKNNWTTPLKGFSDPYLRCLSSEETDYVMREVHEGICENYSKSRSLVHKVVQAGYYWPTMQKDAHAYVKTCDKCQRYGNLIRQPKEELTPMTVSWPFAQ